MPAQTKSRSSQTKTPLQKGAWWKKLLIALCGTYIASKILGITLPSANSASFPSHADGDTYGSRQSAASTNDLLSDDYLDDAWDEPDEVWQEGETDDDDIMRGCTPDDLYNDWNDYGEGYDDDYFD